MMAGRPFLAFFSLAALVSVSACSSTTDPAATRGYNDPYEGMNRDIHAFNKGLDKVAVRPVSVAYTTVVPGGIRTAVSNVADNLSQPANVLNDLLQLNIRSAAVHTARFLLNSTVGVGGLIDASTLWGLPDAEDTGFGDTLYVWGVNEGAYLTLPVLGPSTARDAVGTVVDFATDPVSHLIDHKPERYVHAETSALKLLNERGENKELIDGFYYGSVDSYAQLRSVWLQQRHYSLGKIKRWGSQSTEAATYQDPYADPYSDPYSESYDDPYDAQ